MLKKKIFDYKENEYEHIVIDNYGVLDIEDNENEDFALCLFFKKQKINNSDKYSFERLSQLSTNLTKLKENFKNEYYFNWINDVMKLNPKLYARGYKIEETNEGVALYFMLIKNLKNGLYRLKFLTQMSDKEYSKKGRIEKFSFVKNEDIEIAKEYLTVKANESDIDDFVEMGSILKNETNNETIWFPKIDMTATFEEAKEIIKIEKFNKFEDNMTNFLLEIIFNILVAKYSFEEYEFEKREFPDPMELFN